MGTPNSAERPQRYEVTNPNCKPDWAGQIGGVTPTKEGKGDDQKLIVKFTTSQAKWFLEHGMIKPAGPPPAPGK